ncbi:DUF2167 domain-containing protein [Clostridium ganghwense]|uniref:DUF2167 domain-containing protein n=1 Tax=Clostridium ganghwense TaxID=312089 RepID=A0ABT4CTB7_9CLOT|nr:DUF2167 domain-containing protein [Clostridium ganghwense]MCY6371683.1 DUF2167 domain-containing protein [Clostridium ganghwense]
MYKKLSYLLLVLLSVIFISQPAYADNNSEININWIVGPTTVDVGTNLAELNLSDGYVFANGKDAKVLMKQMDNSISGIEQGIVVSSDPEQDWYVLFEFDDIGYVNDNDAKKIDADKLLSSIKKGTEEDNKKRRSQGTPTLDIIGWDEKPHYDTKTHNLVWSILATSQGEKIVNYNVRILGRKGVTLVTLVADKEKMEQVKPHLQNIISNYSYKKGNKYTDYVKGEDKVSKFGLAALIVGGTAASKLGLLAKILLIFKKLWIVLILGIGGLFKKIIGIFKKKPANTNNNTSYTEINNLDNSNVEVSSEISATANDTNDQNTLL